MKSISVNDLDADAVRLLDSAGPDGIVITKSGQPVARLLPVKPPQKGIGHLYGVLKSKVNIKGDILSTGVEWNAESGYEHRSAVSQRRSTPKRTPKRK